MFGYNFLLFFSILLPVVFGLKNKIKSGIAAWYIPVKLNSNYKVFLFIFHQRQFFISVSLTKTFISIFTAVIIMFYLFIFHIDRSAHLFLSQKHLSICFFTATDLCIYLFTHWFTSFHTDMYSISIYFLLIELTSIFTWHIYVHSFAEIDLIYLYLSHTDLFLSVSYTESAFYHISICFFHRGGSVHSFLHTDVPRSLHLF